MRRTLVLVAALGLTACGGSISADQYPTPEALLAASRAAFRHGDFARAQGGFQRVTFELPPHDPAIAEAKFYIAECEFSQGEYLTASRDFRKMADDNPDHPLASDALLRSGDALAELWLRPELDQTYGDNAMATYQELLGRYPGTLAAERAKTRAAVVVDRLALKDLNNGIFYLRLGAFDPAILYFKDVFKRYTQSRYAPDALIKLVEAYRRIGYDDEARQACAYLRQNYPGVAGLAIACPPAATKP